MGRFALAAALAATSAASALLRDRMAANGGATIKPGPAAFSALLKSDLDKWSRVIREAGVRIE